MFDTTHNTTQFTYKLAVLGGVNSHNNNTYFGCALMLRENASGFTWLLNSFIDTVVAVRPDLSKNQVVQMIKVVYTDEDSAMLSSIPTVLTSSKHHLCLWHLKENLLKKLGSMQLQLVEGDFWTLGKSITIASEMEVENIFHRMRNKFTAQSSAWEAIQYLYERKTKWVRFYFYHLPHLDVKGTSRIESANSVIKRFATSNTHTLVDVQMAVQTHLVKSALKTSNDNTMAALSKHYPRYSNSPVFLESFHGKLSHYVLNRIYEDLVMMNGLFLNYTGESRVQMELRRWQVQVTMSSFKKGVASPPWYVQYEYDEKTTAATTGPPSVMPTNCKCSCFYTSIWGLPCYHIMYVASREEWHTLPCDVLNQRWYVSRIIDKTVDSISVHRSIRPYHGLEVVAQVPSEASTAQDIKAKELKTEAWDVAKKAIAILGSDESKLPILEGVVRYLSTLTGQKRSRPQRFYTSTDENILAHIVEGVVAAGAVEDPDPRKQRQTKDKSAARKGSKKK